MSNSIRVQLKAATLHIAILLVGAIVAATTSPRVHAQATYQSSSQFFDVSQVAPGVYAAIAKDRHFQQRSFYRRSG